MQKEKIGQIAIKNELLSREDLEHLLEIQKQKRKKNKNYEESLLGKLMVEQGLLTQAMLHKLLSEQKGRKEQLFRALEEGQGEKFLFCKYKIEKFIAKGGMGSIFRASDESGNDYAIKILNWNNHNSSLKRRFMRENKILKPSDKVKSSKYCKSS